MRWPFASSAFLALQQPRPQTKDHRINESPCVACIPGMSRSHDEERIIMATTTKESSRRRRRLYGFGEARKIARGHGFDSKEEFDSYECAGAYQLPKDANVVWEKVRMSFVIICLCTSY